MSNVQAIIEAARKRLESRTKGSGNAAFLTLQEGVQTVRLVPLKDATDGLPFQSFQFHYHGQTSFVSPRSFGKTDPIADFGDSITSEGGLSKEDWIEVRKKFSPQERVYAPVIVRGKEDEGVKLWGFSPKIYEQLLAYYTDEDVGVIHDPVEGYDIKVTYTPKTKGGGFAKTEIDVARKPSPLSKDKELVAKWLDEQPRISDHLVQKTDAELREILNNIVNRPSAASVLSSSEETPVKKTEAKPAVSQDVEKEFSEIFDS